MLIISNYINRYYFVYYFNVFIVGWNIKYNSKITQSFYCYILYLELTQTVCISTASRLQYCNWQSGCGPLAVDTYVSVRTARGLETDRNWTAQLVCSSDTVSG